MCLGKVGEFEAEIGARGDVDSLEYTLSLGTVDDLEFCGVVTSDCAAKLSLLVDAHTDAGRDFSKIGNAVETTAQVAPNWFDLSNAEQDRVHESEDIEGHLLGRECANSVHFNLLSDHVGLVHETCTTGPAKR